MASPMRMERQTRIQRILSMNHSSIVYAQVHGLDSEIVNDAHYLRTPEPIPSVTLDFYRDSLSKYHESRLTIIFEELMVFKGFDFLTDPAYLAYEAFMKENYPNGEEPCLKVYWLNSEEVTKLEGRRPLPHARNAPECISQTDRDILDSNRGWSGLKKYTGLDQTDPDMFGTEETCGPLDWEFKRMAGSSELARLIDERGFVLHDAERIEQPFINPEDAWQHFFVDSEAVGDILGNVATPSDDYLPLDALFDHQYPPFHPQVLPQPSHVQQIALPAAPMSPVIQQPATRIAPPTSMPQIRNNIGTEYTNRSFGLQVCVADNSDSELSEERVTRGLPPPEAYVAGNFIVDNEGEDPSYGTIYQVDRAAALSQGSHLSRGPENQNRIMRLRHQLQQEIERVHGRNANPNSELVAAVGPSIQQTATSNTYRPWGSLSPSTPSTPNSGLSVFSGPSKKRKTIANTPNSGLSGTFKKQKYSGDPDSSSRPMRSTFHLSKMKEDGETYLRKTNNEYYDAWLEHMNLPPMPPKSIFSDRSARIKAFSLREAKIYKLFVERCVDEEERRKFGNQAGIAQTPIEVVDDDENDEAILCEKINRPRTHRILQPKRSRGEDHEDAIEIAGDQAAPSKKRARTAAGGKLRMQGYMGVDALGEQSMYEEPPSLFNKGDYNNKAPYQYHPQPDMGSLSPVIYGFGLSNNGEQRVLESCTNQPYDIAGFGGIGNSHTAHTEYQHHPSTHMGGAGMGDYKLPKANNNAQRAIGRYEHQSCKTAELNGTGQYHSAHAGYQRYLSTSIGGASVGGYGLPQPNVDGYTAFSGYSYQQANPQLADNEDSEDLGPDKLQF